ncbi:hypothetical protein FBUS_01020 [Fasciolopsis buskii]|uniref:Uncharacterized protein n=1 Tax=Fasciolopsis buskii TaxID=27845 RepID=A0A8E0VNG1_9TREM|nr:hypothetical protein FBUS_01020 [Fasciolopsis buski]
MIRSMLGVNTVYKDGFATLRFHRTSVRGGMERRRFVRTRPIRLSPQTWNHLLITSGRMHTTVRVNCRPVELTQSSRIAMAPSTWMVRLGVGDKDTGSPRPQLTGFVGQRDKDNHYWVGDIKEFILTTNRSLIHNKCPRNRRKSVSMKAAQNSWFPSGLFINDEPTRMVPMEDFVRIASKLEQLQMMVFQQSARIQTLTSEVARLRNEQLSADRCQCLPRCAIASDGHPFPLGAKWSPERCVTCECTLHGTNCTRITCPILNCTNPIRLEDECCAHCPRDCIFMNQTYVHGEGVIQECVQCICQNGTMNCKQLDRTRFCPKLNCPSSLWVLPPNQCCEVCKKMDLCSLKKNLCDPLAVCRSYGLKYNCTCPPGYRGTGRMRRISTPTHANSRDGCTPICPRGCQNRGKCTQPGTCLCAPGFTGSSCEYDLNECLLGIHQCGSNAVCLNLPGAYACFCRPGFAHRTGRRFTVEEHTIDSILLSTRTMFRDRFGETCEEIQSCGGFQRDSAINCSDDTICVVGEHFAKCLPRQTNTVLPHPWSFIPVDYEFSQISGRRACTLEQINDDQLEPVYLQSEHFLINPWSRNRFCPLCQCQDGILWCPNATHLTLEHLGQSVPGLIDVNRTDNWLGFYPCPHCEPDSLLRFNWTENCCSMCRANTLKDLTRTDSLSDPGPYIWLHNADSVWSICYNLTRQTVCKRLQCPASATSDAIHTSHCSQFLSELESPNQSSKVVRTCPSNELVTDGLTCRGCTCEVSRTKFQLFLNP